MAKVYTQLKNMDACENYQVKIRCLHSKFSTRRYHYYYHLSFKNIQRRAGAGN